MDCVLLHGWGTSNIVWKDFAESLKGFKKVSAPCLYELASNTKDNKFESVANVLSDKIDTEAVIVAWSIGGLVATPLAKLTSKIKAIVFIASAPCFVNKNNWSNVIDQKSIESLYESLSKDAEETLKYFAGLIAHGDESTKESNKMLRSSLADKRHKKVLSSWLMQMQEEDQRKIFAELKLPTQLILGEGDSLIKANIEKQMKHLNSNIESAVINNCGHAPFLSKQKQTSKIINEFIDAKFN